MNKEKEDNKMNDVKKKVIIVGGGFGGLAAAKKLGGNEDVSVTLIDKRNHHLFQPLLYQVATGALSPAEIATPLRHTLRKEDNVNVLLNEVIGFDSEKKEVKLSDGQTETYDELIIAGGSEYNYFGNEKWQSQAPSLKTIEDALDIRTRIFHAFEKAENNPADADRLLTFVIIGGGATGVELAGQVVELAKHGMKRNFKRIDPSQSKVIIIDTAKEVLSVMGDNLAGHATRQLEELGVIVKAGKMVSEVTDKNVKLSDINDKRRKETIETETVIWAAGVTAGKLAHLVASDFSVNDGPGGRLITDEYCQLLNNEDVYVIGDMAMIEGKPLPGLATVAMQEGKYVAKRIAGKTDKKFKYRDKGSLATIGRNRAVGTMFGVELHGMPAWLAWLLIHLRYLAGIQNRVVVSIRWVVNYFTFGRSTRLITNTRNK